MLLSPHLQCTHGAKNTGMNRAYSSVLVGWILAASSIRSSLTTLSAVRMLRSRCAFYGRGVDILRFFVDEFGDVLAERALGMSAHSFSRRLRLFLLCLHK